MWGECMPVHGGQKPTQQGVTTTHASSKSRKGEQQQDACCCRACLPTYLRHAGAGSVAVVVSQDLVGGVVACGMVALVQYLQVAHGSPPTGARHEQARQQEGHEMT